MTFSRGRFASSSEHSHMKDPKAEHFPTGQWSLHVFPCSSHQRGWVISLLSPGQNRNTNYCGLEINRKKYGGPIAGGQDGLPLLLLSLLSHQLPETHLLPDLHLVVFVLQQRGTSAHRTKHDISQHWADVASGDTWKTTVCLRGSFLVGVTLVSFYSLACPLASSSCL